MGHKLRKYFTRNTGEISGKLIYVLSYHHISFRNNFETKFIHFVLFIKIEVVCSIFIFSKFAEKYSEVQQFMMNFLTIVFSTCIHPFPDIGPFQQLPFILLHIYRPLTNWSPNIIVQFSWGHSALLLVLWSFTTLSYDPM